MRKNFFLFIMLTLILSGCAHQPSSVTYAAPGFFTGLWHGIIAPLAMVGHIFDSSIRIYEFPNGGGWYDFGFLIGLGGIGTGAASR